MFDKDTGYDPASRMVWEEISLTNLAFNLDLFYSFLKSGPNQKKPKVMAVVKANAYGHGAEQVSKKALDCGVSCLGVALIQEGIKLRKSGISQDILVLGQPCMEMIEKAIQNDLTISVTSYETAKAVSEKASGLQRKARIHVKVDTGMNRIGIGFEDAVKEIIKIEGLKNIRVDGVFTHFSSASERDPAYTKMQFERFEKIVMQTKQLLPQIGTFHAANSSAFLRFKNTHLDMVRIGILMYGLNPFGDGFESFLDEDAVLVLKKIRPVLALKSKISFIKKVPKDTCISYCASFKTKRESIIATIPIGYADGYARLLSNKAMAIFKGRYVPVVGNITMDQCMLDLSDALDDIHSLKDEPVILIGRDKDKEVSASDLAKLIGTINYEIVCNIKERIPKTYIS
jgi:alanine racemase